MALIALFVHNKNIWQYPFAFQQQEPKNAIARRLKINVSVVSFIKEYCIKILNNILV
jgi:hypothetical protein